MHTYTYIYTHAYTYIYTCQYTYIHAHIYTHTYNMYICTHASTSETTARQRLRGKPDLTLRSSAPLPVRCSPEGDHPLWPAAQLPVHEERQIIAGQRQPTAAHHTITTARRPDYNRPSALCSEQIHPVHDPPKLRAMEATPRNEVTFLPFSRVLYYLSRKSQSLSTTLHVYGQPADLLADTGIPPLYITQNLQLAQFRSRLHSSPLDTIQHFLWQLWQPLLQVVPLDTLEYRMQTAICRMDLARRDPTSPLPQNITLAKPPNKEKSYKKYFESRYSDQWRKHFELTLNNPPGRVRAYVRAYVHWHLHNK